MVFSIWRRRKNCILNYMEKTRGNAIARLRYNIHNTERRTIFVIGAGASSEVASLPLGKELAGMLLEQWQCGGSDTFKAILDEIAIKYGFDKNDVKTILFALSIIDKERLVNEVCRYLSVPDKIHSSFYSQVSRFFLEKKIDVVLNFNFDTLLDHALAEYCPEINYSKIISDEEAAASEFGIDDRLYIKPHGSVDCKRSLRFQRADFYDMGRNMSGLIARLVGEHPVDIVTVGFRAKFYEFTDILKEKMHMESEIFIVDKVEDVLDNNLLSFYHGGFIQIDECYVLTDFMKQLNL